MPDQQLHRGSRRLRWWYTMRAWDRVFLAVVVLAALAISAVLIVYGPGWETIGSTSQSHAAVMATTTPGALFPPGTRWYYRRGQWFPPAAPLP
jgi:hypothetical protein